MRKLLATALLASAPVYAELPVFLNSNDVDNALPQPNLPVEQYGASIPSISTATAPQQYIDLNEEFFLSELQIEGGTVYEFEEIAGLFMNLIEQRVTLSQILAVTRQITERYQQDGYALSYAYVPLQTLANGRVLVTLVEGYIEDHQLTGDVGAVEARIHKFAAPLLNERPLKRETFERYTSLMSQIPGVKVLSSVSAPTTTKGGVSLITQAEHRPFDATAALQKDRGDDLQVLGTVISSSHTSAGEQVSVSVLAPPGDDDERFVRLDYSQYVSDEGTRLHAYGSVYKSSPDKMQNIGGAKTEMERKNLRASVGVTHPFKISPSEIINAGVRLYGVNDKRDFARLSPLPVYKKAIELESNVRVAALEGDWQTASAKQMRLLSAGLYQGINGLGARSRLKVLGQDVKFDKPDVDFTKLRISGMQRNSFFENWQGVASAALYWTEDVLPESEQVVFGDRNFGRGYADDQAHGDKGWGVGYELSYNYGLDYRWVSLLQPYVAMDHARAWFNDGGFKSRLSSAAFGLRVADNRYYNLGLELARPLGDRAYDTGNRSIRYGVTLSYRL